MSSRLTRRTVLAGGASLIGSAGFARAPLSTERPVPRGASPSTTPGPSNRIIEKAGLGGVVSFAVLDSATGEVIEHAQGGRRMPPASTMKAVTTLYALDRLGPSHRFSTSVLMSGVRNGGRIEGDLVLAGGGDPTLDTDRLGELAMALRDLGITEVTGRFLVWNGALPQGRFIDGDQPDHVSYNPAFGGLNLNFNRVHFEWKRAGDDFNITMQARAERLRPSTDVARMAIADRKAPVFSYREAYQGAGDRWSVARAALGRDGARWLPVRVPALYCGDVFRTLARSNGIVLQAPEVTPVLPEQTVRLAWVESDQLVDMLRSMMRYSTNLTAEAVGLSSSLANGVPVASLLASGSRMAGWATSQFGTDDIQFRDHSGLGYGSAVSPVALAKILVGSRAARPLMRPVTLPENAPNGAVCVAKTGTLNFVSSLAGYLTTASGRDLTFAILTADVGRRDAIPPEARERPPGARSWSRRSRSLQKSLLANWAKA